jgi:hypothetical protein
MASGIQYGSALLLSLLLTACGGGGGSGSTGGDGGSSAYGVRVLHAAIDGAPVDVVSSLRQEAVVSQTIFADSKGYRPLPGGEQRLSLTKAFSSADAIGSFPTSVTSRDRYSILLYGDNLTFGLRSKLLVDEVPATISGAFVRFVNGVTGASAIIVTSNSAQPQQISFGDHSDYLPFSAGSVQFSASRAVDGNLVVSTNRTLEEGHAYTLLISGEIGYYATSTLLVDE